jgi:hypothetical protein
MYVMKTNGWFEVPDAVLATVSDDVLAALREFERGDPLPADWSVDDVLRHACEIATVPVRVGDPMGAALSRRDAADDSARAAWREYTRD